LAKLKCTKNGDNFLGHPVHADANNGITLPEGSCTQEGMP